MSITRRDFLKMATVGFAANEAARLQLGFNLFSPLLSLLRGEPVVPFSPLFMSKYYLQSAENLPRIKETQQQIRQVLSVHRSETLADTLKLSFDAAQSVGTPPELFCRNSLLSVASLAYLNKADIGHQFPYYLSNESIESEPWDKSIHALLNAYIAFECCRYMDQGTGQENEYLQGARDTIGLVGQNNVAFVRESLKNDRRRNAFLPDRIVGLDDKEQYVYDLLSQSGIVYEVLTTVNRDEEYNSHTHEYNALKFLITRLFVGDYYSEGFVRYALNLNPLDVAHGLLDRGVNRDLIGNDVGILLGIALYRLSKQKKHQYIPKIPFDIRDQQTDQLLSSSYSLGIAPQSQDVFVTA